MLTTVLPNMPTTIGFITHHARGAQPWAADARSLDGTLLHHLIKDHGFVALPNRQDKGHRLAATLGTQVDLGAETALAAAQRFGLSGCMVRACRVLMRSNDGTIDVMRLPIQLPCRIGLRLHLFPNGLPDPFLAPAVVAAGNRLPLPIAFRNIAPGRSGALEPQDAIDNRPMRMIGLPGPGLTGGSSGSSFAHWASLSSPRFVDISE